jgi:hypothetical protein
MDVAGMGTIESARSLDRECEWVQAHAALTRLARERAAADAEEGRWLVRAFRAAVHAHLGHGSFAEYVERVFGYKPRTTQEKLRVAEALESLPELARALDTGEVGWCAVRELTRVAVAETEGDWLAVARGKTLRQLEELVANKSPGDTPEGPDPRVPRSRVLRFEVAPETFALFRDAMRELRRSAGGGLDDDAVLLFDGSRGTGWTRRRRSRLISSLAHRLQRLWPRRPRRRRARPRRGHGRGHG